MSTENSCLVSEKIHLTKIKIIAPAAHATLWRSFSTLKRVKKSTFFTMTKSRQNHLLMILIFNEELDEISIKPITNKLIKERKSSIATFRLHQSSICLLYFIYCYCLISFLSMFSFNNPPPIPPEISRKLQGFLLTFGGIEKKHWKEMAYVSARGFPWSMYKAQRWFLDARLPLYTLCTLWATPTPTYNTCVIYFAN